MRKLVVLAAVLMLAGCGTSSSATDPPTVKPPPTSPSDPRPPKDLLVGRITRGGSGPCYGLETDEGKQYALYSNAGMSLDVGTTVRVEIAPLRLKINCGAGEHFSAVKIDRVG